MGFLAPSPDVPEVLTVATLTGPVDRSTAEGTRLERWARARTFVLEDRRVAVVRQATAGSAIERVEYPVEASEWNSRSKQLTVVLGGDDPEVAGTVLTVTNHCGCGWGAISNAGPTDGPYRLAKVRPPEWHTVTR